MSIVVPESEGRCDCLQVFHCEVEAVSWRGPASSQESDIGASIFRVHNRPGPAAWELKQQSGPTEKRQHSSKYLVGR